MTGGLGGTSLPTVPCRMAQKYYEYVNYKEEHVQEQQQAPRGACNTYIIIFQTIFYACFHVSTGWGAWHGQGAAPGSLVLSIPCYMSCS